MPRIEIGSPIDSETLRAELPASIEIDDKGLKYYEFDATGFSLFVLVLAWAASIPANIIASAIYDAIKRRSKETPKRIIIDDTHVEFDREKITRIIQRRVEVEEEPT